MGNCNWCGKEIGSSVGVCSNKCQAERNSYNGISPTERPEELRDVRSRVGCAMSLIIIYLIAATFFPFFTRKLLGFHDYMELTPWDTTVKRIDQYRPRLIVLLVTRLEIPIYTYG